MPQSLSSFLRAAADAHFEGPVPAAARDRIRFVENAERAYDRSLSPLERAVKSLSLAYADVLNDSALVEASRELRVECGAEGAVRYGNLLQQRTAVLAESAAWLSETARLLAERARSELSSGSRDPGGSA